MKLKSKKKGLAMEKKQSGLTKSLRLRLTPEILKAVEKIINSGEFGNKSDYLRFLVQQDLIRRAGSFRP